MDKELPTKQAEPAEPAEADYASEQAVWVAENRLEAGDRVLVIGSCESRTGGWENTWPPIMNKAVGLVVPVAEVEPGTRGIALKLTSVGFHDMCEKKEGDRTDCYVSRCGVFWFPFFALVKIEEDN